MQHYSVPLDGQCPSHIQWASRPVPRPINGSVAASMSLRPLRPVTTLSVSVKRANRFVCGSIRHTQPVCSHIHNLRFLIAANGVTRHCSKHSEEHVRVKVVG